MFFLTSGNDQLDEAAWRVLDAATRDDKPAVIAALPRIRQALADLPMDEAKKAQVMAVYDEMLAQFAKEFV